MKKLLSVVVLMSLCLSLAACGGKERNDAPPAFSPASDAQTLLQSGCFSEELEELDADIACAMYGIDADTVTAAACYGSTGATAEELAVFKLKSSDDAAAALKQLQYRVEDRTADMESYLPGEVPKLEKAVLRQRGDTVLLVVANDYGPVDSFLGE